MLEPKEALTVWSKIKMPEGVHLSSDLDDVLTCFKRCAEVVQDVVEYSRSQTDGDTDFTLGYWSGYRQAHRDVVNRIQNKLGS